MLVKVNSQLRIVCFIRIGQAQKPIETPPDVWLNEFVMKIRIISSIDLLFWLCQI